MPEFLKESIENLAQFAIWKIDESEDELLEGLTISNIEKNKLNQLKNHVHRKGFLATRQLLKGIFHQLDKVPHFDRIYYSQVEFRNFLIIV